MPDDSEPDDAEDVAVLIPAAGEGRRLGGPRKQYRTLGDRPLLVQVLLLFEESTRVDHLIVAVPEDHVEMVSDRLHAEGLHSVAAVVSGGQSRQHSVRHALRAVPASADMVLVHDAARPFVAAQEVHEVLDAVRTHGAASLALPVADTLRKGTEDVFGETVPRQDLFRMQTPQGFRRHWLEEAHRVAAASDAEPATDDVGLVQRIGRSVRLVRGSRRNFKITDAADWRLAQMLWGEWVEDSDRSASRA